MTDYPSNGLRTPIGKLRLSDFPHAALGRNGLEIEDGMTWEEFVDLGEVLVFVERASLFQIGDWGAYGEARFGHEFAQAVEEGSYAAQTVKVAIWVATRIPTARRRPEVSWSHHRAVAGLEPSDADNLLALAASDNLTVAAVREKARAIKKPPADLDSRPMPLPLEDVDVLTEAVRMLRELVDVCRAYHNDTGHESTGASMFGTCDLICEVSAKAEAFLARVS